MKEIMNDLLGGLMPEDNLTLLMNHHETYADVKLTELGVDSLAMMEVVLRIEENYGKVIDYNTFEVRFIETPRAIHRFLNDM